MTEIKPFVAVKKSCLLLMMIVGLSFLMIEVGLALMGLKNDLE